MRHENIKLIFLELFHNDLRENKRKLKMKGSFMKLYVLILTTILTSESFGHGESKPGPHGGFIQMPGAFHTEVAPDPKDNSFQLFLLDMEFKNPTTRNSSVAVHLEESDGKKVTFKCSVMGGNHFHCVPIRTYSQTGKLIIMAKRDGAEGKSVYELPLKHRDGTTVSPTKHEQMDHSKH